jgi:hypothetical protein
MAPTTYQQAIAAARGRYELAMADAAADVLVISEKYDKPIQSVCKDIAPDNWDALRKRAQRLEKAQVRGGTSADDVVRPMGTRVRGEFNAASLPTKVELIAEALDDPLVRASVQAHLERPVPSLKATPRELSLNEEWVTWLGRANSLLVTGARLENRTDASGGELTAHAASGRLIYQRITERKLDVEIRQLLDTASREWDHS